MSTPWADPDHDVLADIRRFKEHPPPDPAPPGQPTLVPQALYDLLAPTGANVAPYPPPRRR